MYLLLYNPHLKNNKLHSCIISITMQNIDYNQDCFINTTNVVHKKINYKFGTAARSTDEIFSIYTKIQMLIRLFEIPHNTVSSSLPPT